MVDGIGDVFLDIVPHFGPFVSYGAHQLYGKYAFEKEKSSNPAFAQFVEVSLICVFTSGQFRCFRPQNDFQNREGWS